MKIPANIAEPRGWEIRLEITGVHVLLTLAEPEGGRILARSRWEDKRDLSQRFFCQLRSLLERHQLTLVDMRHMSFSCDSPYFGRTGAWQDFRLEDLDSTGKCGFTAWQTGEVIAGVINFALR